MAPDLIKPNLLIDKMLLAAQKVFLVIIHDTHRDGEN